VKPSTPNLLKDERVGNLFVFGEEQNLADNLRSLRVIIHKRQEQPASLRTGSL